MTCFRNLCAFLLLPSRLCRVQGHVFSAQVFARCVRRRGACNHQGHPCVLHFLMSTAAIMKFEIPRRFWAIQALRIHIAAFKKGIAITSHRKKPSELELLLLPTS